MCQLVHFLQYSVGLIGMRSALSTHLLGPAQDIPQQFYLKPRIFVLILFSKPSRQKTKEFKNSQKIISQVVFVAFIHHNSRKILVMFKVLKVCLGFDLR